MTSLLKVDGISANGAAAVTVDDALIVNETLSVTGATTLAALAATSGNFSGNLTAGDSVADAHSFTGALSISGTNSTNVLKIAASGGDLLAIQPFPSGSGAALITFNAGLTDFEPATYTAESHTFNYRTGVGTVAAGITLDTAGDVTLPAGALIAKGPLSANQTSAVVLSQESGTTSRLWAYGADGATVGVLEIYQVASDGSPGITHTFDNAGGLTLAGALAVSGGSISVSEGNVSIGSTGANQRLFQAANTAGTVQYGIFGSGTGYIAVTTNDPFERYTNNTLWETLSTAGAFRWHAYGAGALTTDASGNITAASDESAKRNIRPFTRGLESILDINPILHGYSLESGLDQTRDDYAGFSANNVMGLIPEAVGKNQDEKDEEGNVVKEGYLTLNPFVILAASVNAIKELNARLTALEK